MLYKRGLMARTVLIIEDDKAIADTLEEALKLLGFNVLVAGNGKDALDQLERVAKPDLILLDLMMPVMDGWEFHRRKLQLDTISSIPVILITADGNSEVKAKAIGAQGHLTKPFEFVDLIRITAPFAG